MVITVLRMGWNPRNSTPRLVDRLFRQREAVLPPRPVYPASAEQPQPEQQQPEHQQPPEQQPPEQK